MDIDITGITRKEAESLLESLNKVHQTGHDAQVIEWFKSVLDQGIRAVLAVETSYRSLPLKKFKKKHRGSLTMTGETV